MAESGAAAGGSEEKKSKGRAAKFVSGAVAGVATTVVLQPLDVVKTHLQAAQPVGGQRQGIRDVVSSLVRREGVPGLWRGTGPACVRVGLGAGLYFGVLGTIISALAPNPGSSVNEKLSDSVAFSAGALTRAFASMVCCPITVVKTRMEIGSLQYGGASSLRYTSTAAGLASIARTEGVAGLYSGMLATLARDAPYSGLYLVMYNRLQHSLRELQPQSSQAYVNFCSGAVAGAGATLLTHPPDVIRTRLQLNPQHNAGIVSTVRSIVQERGLRGLYSGVLPRVGRRALNQAFVWTFFEEISTWVQRRL